MKENPASHYKSEDKSTMNLQLITYDQFRY